MLALLLVWSCAGGSASDSGPVPAPSPDPRGWTDVPCQVLPDDLQLSEPVPYGPEPAVPEYSAYLDWLAESPNRADEEGDPERYLDDLVVHDGALWSGLGDWGYNTGSLYCQELGGRCPHEDDAGHGVPLLRWGPGETEPTTSAPLHEEEIEQFRRLGELVVVLSTDPSLGDPAPDCAAADADPACPEEQDRSHPRFEIGNHHRLVDGALSSADGVPAVYHQFDIAALGDVLYMVGSGKPESPDDYGGSYAMVWRSVDDGASWQIHWHDANVQGKRRLDALIPLGDRLFATGHHDHPDGDVPLRYEIVDDGVVPADDLVIDLIDPLATMALDPDTVVVWSEPLEGAAVIRSVDGTVDVTPVPVDAGAAVRVVDAWLACEGDMLLLMRIEDIAGKRHQVVRTRDLQSFEVALEWTATIRPRSLAWWQDRLFFGASEDRLLATP